MKITVNVFDKASLTRAIAKVDKFRKELEAKNDKLVERLAEIGQNAAAAAYGPSVKMSVRKDGPGKWTILAEGRGVCFIEFGTGVYASKADIYEELPFSVSPGSWSIEHRSADDPMRYDNWIANGKSGYDWPYSRVPHPGMLAAYEAIKAAIPAEVEKIFA